MKMYFTKMMGVCCTFSIMMLGLTSAIAQDCQNATQYPSSAIVLNNDADVQSINSCNYAEEYSIITNVEAGADYEFSVADNFITVREGAVDGPVISTGLATASVSAASGADLFVHWTVNAECETAASCIATSVQCTSCTSPLDCLGEAGGTALPNTPCDDGNPATVGSEWNEECECVGGIVPSGNSVCDNALPVECGTPVSGTTVGALGDDIPTCVTSNGTGGGVWYEFIAPYDGTATYDLCDTDYDSKIRIFTGACEALECVTGNDDSFSNCGSGGASFATSDIEAGVTYYILIHGFSGNEGNFTLNLSCEEAPEFECEELEANIGDECADAPGFFDSVVTADCECVGTPYDCPLLSANIGDPCDDEDVTTEGSTVDEACECTGGTPIVFEGCTNFGITFGSADPECNTIAQISGAWAFEQATVTVVDGDDYFFSVDNPDYYVTVSDENDNILAFGQEGASWTSTFDGSVNFYSHVGPGCPETGGSATEHNKFVERLCDTTGFDCPEELANIGDPCDDNDPSTEGSTLNNECECTGGTAIVFEGCNEGDSFGTRTPECSGPAAVQSGAWTFEYVTVTVEEGIEYTFTISNPAYFASVTTNDSVANILAAAQETTTWTSTFDGTVRFYSHAGPGCPETTGSATSHTRTIQAGTCNFDCPTLEANVGDACELAGFFDTTVDENCDCVGTPFDCDADGEFSNIGDPCVIEGEGGSFSTSVATEAVGFPTTFDANAAYNFTVPSGFEGNYDLTIAANGETFNGSWRSEYRVRVTDPNGVNVTDGATGGASDEWQPTAQTQGGVFTGDITLEGLSGIEGEWTVEVRMSFNEGETINAIVDLAFDFASAGTDGVIDENCECIVPCLSVGGELAIDGSDRVCVGTGSEVTFDNAVLTGAAGDNSIWVLTEGNTNVLATDATGPNFDFDGLSASGIYKIRHISYANDVDINEVLVNPLTTEGCWEVSNSIRVFASELPEPGTIELLNASNELCTGQGPASYAAVAVTGEDMSGSRYVLTDENGDVVGVKADPFFNLNNRTPGTYTIYRAAWATGFAPAANGNNVNDPGTCVALSNGVEVILSDCEAAASITSNPNPTAGASWVTFTVDEPQQVQVEVYDMAGRHIKTVFNQNAAGGQDYRMQFDGTSLPNGVYMYRMTTESQVIVDKFMIAR